jgi:hypothetical protein
MVVVRWVLTSAPPLPSLPQWRFFDPYLISSVRRVMSSFWFVAGFSLFESFWLEASRFGWLISSHRRIDGGGGAAVVGFVSIYILCFGVDVGVWVAIFLLNSEVWLAELEGLGWCCSWLVAGTLGSIWPELWVLLWWCCLCWFSRWLAKWFWVCCIHGGCARGIHGLGKLTRSGQTHPI